MKPFLLKTLIVGCLMGLVAVGFAQNENKKKGAKGDPTTKLRDKVKEAELGEELTAKVNKIIDEHAPKLKEANDKVEAVLTDEQKSAQRAAKKAAKDAGRKASEDEIKAALKLTDEQKKKMDEAQKELGAVRAEMNKAISALLTAEQQEKVGVKAKRKKKNA